MSLGTGPKPGIDPFSVVAVSRSTLSKVGPQLLQKVAVASAAVGKAAKFPICCSTSSIIPEFLLSVDDPLRSFLLLFRFKIRCIPFMTEKIDFPVSKNSRW